MTSTTARPDVHRDLRDALEQAGASASLHIRDVDDPTREVGIEPDRICVTASTYKIAVLLEVACQADEGTLALTDRIRIPADEHRHGNGTSAMRDEIDLSVRDLALLMMQISDNTATDTLQALVTTERITERLAALGLQHTVIRLNCAALIAEMTRDLGGDPDDPGIHSDLQGGDPLGLGHEGIVAALAASPALAGKTGNTSTARDMSELVSLIWRDEAGPAVACAEVRRIMVQQCAPHRLSAAYPDGPLIAGKTGTFWGGIRNEVGVVEFAPDERYAVAVFLRQDGYSLRDSRADAAIGAVARIGIDHLRALRS